MKILPTHFTVILCNMLLKEHMYSKLSQYKIKKIINKFLKIKNKNSFFYHLTTDWNDEKLIINDFKSLENETSKYFSNENCFEESMMIADFENYLTDDILCKVDRASMFNSLETRAPYLNSNLINYVTNLPLNFKLSRGKSKIIQKKILEKYIPKEYIYTPKKGFSVPLSSWLKLELKDWVDEKLSKDNCEKHNFFNYSIVKKIKNEHFSGLADHQSKLWSLIQFNSWYNEYQ